MLTAMIGYRLEQLGRGGAEWEIEDTTVMPLDVVRALNSAVPIQKPGIRLRALASLHDRVRTQKYDA